MSEQKREYVVTQPKLYIGLGNEKKEAEVGSKIMLTETQAASRSGKVRPASGIVIPPVAELEMPPETGDIPPPPPPASAPSVVDTKSKKKGS